MTIGFGQLRVSAVLTNGAYVLNLDYDHYVNNSSALREAMCFLMDPVAGNRTCFVQFPLQPAADDVGPWAGRDSVFFDVRNADMVTSCGMRPSIDHANVWYFSMVRFRSI